MPLNDPNAPQSVVRQPRLRVFVNGLIQPNAATASVNNNNHYQADRFSVDFALPLGSDNSWWDSQATLLTDVQIGFVDPGSGAVQQWTSLIVGEADRIDFDQETGALHLDGRDLSAQMIEAKTQDTFQNKTSSEVVQIIAARHGLTAQVTTTTTPIGRYYDIDHDHVTTHHYSRATTEWDLLTGLARREGFDLFMNGATLCFQPATSSTADPFVVQWTPQSALAPRSNVQRLRMSRSMLLAKDVVVALSSWRSADGRGFTVYSPHNGASLLKSGKALLYTFQRPNLTEQAAQSLADQYRTEISKHERTITFKMPGITPLTPRDILLLQGTGTSFDQIYYIESIERRIDFVGGFSASVQAKNQSPQTQAQASS
jgi:phage protein D